MLQPVLLVAETFYWQSGQPGLYRTVIERIAEFDWYRGVETVVVDDPQERKTLRSLCEKYNLTLMQWLTKPLLDRNLSLSDCDEEKRKQAVQCVLDGAERAHETGAFAIALVSGADPGPELRPRAKQAFVESARAIAEFLAQRNMTFIIEPLDREQHKKQVIGPTVEAVEVIQELRQINPRSGICWDSAHVCLMGEDIGDALSVSVGSALQLHFANAVLDPDSYFYGDQHFSPDSGLGFLDLDCMVSILQQAVEAGLVNQDNMTRVGMESRTLPGNDPWRNERHCRELLQAAFARMGWR